MATSAGVVSVTTGSLIVSGTLTSFVAAEGDQLVLRGVTAIIAKAISSSQLQLARPWPGPNIVAASDWDISLTGPYWQSSVTTNKRVNELLTKFEAGPIKWDQAGTLSARNKYNDQTVGFTYLSTDPRPFRFYTKLANTNSASDWSEGQILGTVEADYPLFAADVGLGRVDNTSDAEKTAVGNPIGDAIRGMTVQPARRIRPLAERARDTPSILDWHTGSGRNITDALSRAINDLLAGSAGATLYIPGNRIFNSGPWLLDPLVIQPITGNSVPLRIVGDYFGTQIQPSGPVPKSLNEGHWIDLYRAKFLSIADLSLTDPNKFVKGDAIRCREDASSTLPIKLTNIFASDFDTFVGIDYCEGVELDGCFTIGCGTDFDNRRGGVNGKIFNHKKLGGKHLAVLDAGYNTPGDRNSGVAQPEGFMLRNIISFISVKGGASILMRCTLQTHIHTVELCSYAQGASGLRADPGSSRIASDAAVMWTRATSVYAEGHTASSDGLPVSFAIDLNAATRPITGFSIHGGLMSAPPNSGGGLRCVGVRNLEAHGLSASNKLGGASAALFNTTGVIDCDFSATNAPVTEDAACAIEWRGDNAMKLPVNRSGLSSYPRGPLVAYTPSAIVAANGAQFTSVSSSLRWRRVGSRIEVAGNIRIAKAGPGAGQSILFVLPAVGIGPGTGTCRENALTGYEHQVYMIGNSATNAFIALANNAGSAQDGAVYELSFSYEAA